MRALRVVGLTEDGEVVLEDPVRLERFRVPADERLRAAARGDLSRLGQIAIELESQLRPREIQARIRAGASVEQVAAAAGVPEQKIERFAYPVLLERFRTAEIAQRAHPVRADGPDNRTLAEVVAHTFGLRGQEYEGSRWDSWKGEDGRWVVALCWRAGRSDNRAHWTFQPGAHGGTVAALDEHASDLVEGLPARPLRTVGAVVDMTRPEEEPPPAPSPVEQWRAAASDGYRERVPHTPEPGRPPVERGGARSAEPWRPLPPAQRQAEPAPEPRNSPRAGETRPTEPAYRPAAERAPVEWAPVEWAPADRPGTERAPAERAAAEWPGTDRPVEPGAAPDPRGTLTAELTRPGPARPEQARPEQPLPEQPRPEQARPVPAPAAGARSERVPSDRVPSEVAREVAREVVSGASRPDAARPGRGDAGAAGGQPPVPADAERSGRVDGPPPAPPARGDAAPPAPAAEAVGGASRPATPQHRESAEPAAGAPAAGGPAPDAPVTDPPRAAAAEPPAARPPAPEAPAARPPAAETPPAAAPAAAAPDADEPVPDAPAPDVPATDVPAPDVLAPDVLAPDAPAAQAPAAADAPAPEAPVSRRTKKGKPVMPSWDEVLLGVRKPR